MLKQFFTYIGEIVCQKIFLHHGISLSKFIRNKIFKKIRFTWWSTHLLRLRRPTRTSRPHTYTYILRTGSFASLQRYCPPTKWETIPTGRSILPYIIASFLNISSPPEPWELCNNWHRDVSLWLDQFPERYHLVAFPSWWRWTVLPPHRFDPKTRGTILTIRETYRGMALLFELVRSWRLFLECIEWDTAESCCILLGSVRLYEPGIKKIFKEKEI